MGDELDQKNVVQSSMLHSSLELLVHRIIQSIEKNQLSEMKDEFHSRLRITQRHPDNPELIEDLWDFFYDWCVFEQQLIERIPDLTPEEQATWEMLRKLNFRSLFTVHKIAESVLKLKDMFGKKLYVIPLHGGTQLLGLTRGDVIECRLVETESGRKRYSLVRTFSYHPTEIHAYIKKKYPGVPQI